MSVPTTGGAEARASRRLEIRDLACRRGERTLFDGLRLDVGAGEIVWLRAANGYGKTTLLRCIAGLAQPDGGTIGWNGDAASMRPPLLYLGHDNALKDDLTVLESSRHLARLHGLDADDAAIVDALRRFGLHARRHLPVRALSQGQRRRVALARLCLSDPRATWVLDEPCDALDGDGVALVCTLMAEHAERRGNVLFTSHVAPSFARAGDHALRVVQLDAAATA